MSAVKIEEKLFQNRYLVDPGRPHIRIREPAVCAEKCITHACTVCCPAGCYSRDGAGVELITDGCLECGTCRVICNNVDWEYPRGGYGIQFKFG